MPEIGIRLGKVKKPLARVVPSSRQLLLDCAKLLFAKKGFDGVTVRDIVGAAKVNVSLVSYHFESKEGLYREILSTFGSRNLVIVKGTLAPPADLKELSLRLQMYMERIFESHFQDPAMYRIVDQEIELRSAQFRDVLEGMVLETFRTVYEFFVAAQKNKVIIKTIDPLVPASTVQGFIRQELRIDVLRYQNIGETIKHEPYRRRIISDFVGMLSQGLKR